MNVFTLATRGCPGGSMVQLAMLVQGGFGRVRFANMVRNRESARHCSPTGAFRRRGGVQRPTSGNGAQSAERAGMPAELRGMP